MKSRALTLMFAGCVIGATQSLAGCGQTGPLHLPADAPAKEGYLLKKRQPKPAPETAVAPPPVSPLPPAVTIAPAPTSAPPP